MKCRSVFPRSLLGVVFLTVGLSATSQSVSAQTYNWNGPNNAVWSVGPWDTTVPGVDNTAVFSDLGAGATVDVDAGATAGGITFNNNVSNTLLRSTGGHTLTLNNNGSGVTITSAAGSHTISANIDSTASNDAVNWRGAGTTILTATNTIGWPGGFQKDGWSVSDGGKLVIASGVTTVADGNHGGLGGTNTIMEVSGTGIFTAGGHDTIWSGNNGQFRLKGSGQVNLRGSGIFAIANGNDISTMTIQDSATFSVDRNVGTPGSWSAGDLVLCMGWGACTGIVNQVGGTVNLPDFQPWNTGNGPGLILGGIVTGNPVLTTYNLNGGTLNVSAVFNVCTTYNIDPRPDPDPAGNYPLVPPGTQNQTAIFNFNGGTLVAVQDDSTDPVAIDEGTAHLMGNLSHAYVGVGGARIDTAGFNCSINQSLEQSPLTFDGGLTKLGLGTLTLLQPSTYTGPTFVQAGTLCCTNNPASLASAPLSIAASALVDLAYTGTNTIPSLKIGANYKGPGVWGGNGSAAPHKDAAFSATGPGAVKVVPEPTNFRIVAGQPNIDVPGTALGSTYTLLWKAKLTDPTWTALSAPSGSKTGVNGTLTLIDATAAGQPQRFYRIAATQ